MKLFIVGDARKLGHRKRRILWIDWKISLKEYKDGRGRTLPEVTNYKNNKVV